MNFPMYLERSGAISSEPKFCRPKYRSTFQQNAIRSHKHCKELTRPLLSLFTLLRASPAYEYESNQYRDKYYRHISEGGWPFSTSAHGWPISDCTSEGLKATLCLLKTKTIKEGLKDQTLKPIPEERLFKAIHVLLTYQNEDGGTHISILGPTQTIVLTCELLRGESFWGCHRLGDV